MGTRIVAINCVCDAMLKAYHHRDTPRCQMTDAKVMTISIIAAVDYGDNLEKARRMPQADTLPICWE